MRVELKTMFEHLIHVGIEIYGDCSFLVDETTFR